MSLNDGYIQAVEEMGAYLSATAPGPFANSLHIAVTPQIQNTSGALGNITNWVPVSGIFTAAGGEQFITIGNFNPDSLTTITQVGTTGSYGTYYFVDDVNVTLAEGIHSADGGNISVYPNPVSGELIINNEELIIASVVLTDVTGAVVWNSTRVAAGKTVIDVRNFAKGIYFLTLYAEESRYTFKVIK